MSTFQDTFTDATNLSSQVGAEVVNGQLQPLDHDDSTTLTFNGTNQDATAFGYFGVTGTSARTFMCWIKNTDSSGNGTIIHFGLAGTNGARYLIQLESGVPTLRAIGNVVAWGSNLSDGQWHHLALTNPVSPTTSQFSCYVDGIKVTPSTVTGSDTINISADGYVSLMARTDQPNSSIVNLYLPGSMDDTRLYSRELTEDEIFSLVHAGIEPSTTNLQAHWLFNEGSGSSVNDETANNRDLTLTGSPTWTTTHKPFYAQRSLSTSTQIVTNQASVSDFDFTVSKRSAGTLGRFQFSDDGSTWVNANGDSLTGYGSYDFDGVNDQIACGSDASIDNIFAGGGTVMFWAFIRSAGEGNLGRIIHKGPAGLNDNSTQILIYSTGGIGLWREFTGNTGLWTLGYNIFNQWVHVAITYNENSVSNDPILYINGVAVSFPEASTPSGSAESDAAYNLTIGSWNGATRWFDGYLADIRIYKGDILSSTTIRDYYLHATEPSETLDAHWKFNGNALDETANNNDGSVTGAINKTDFEFVPPIGNYDLSDSSVLSFDGSNDYLEVSDNDVFSFGNASTDSPFSISLWANAKDLTSDLVNKYSGLFGSTNEYLFQINSSGGLELSLFDQTQSVKIGRQSEDISHLLNEWHHFAATYDGGSSSSGIKLYIDGNRVDTSNANVGSYVAMHNTTTPLRMAVCVYVSASYSQVDMANVAIWSDVRTQAEIIAEVENGYVETGNANLIAYYPLDGNANDYLGNYNGTIDGATTVTNYKRPAIVAPSQTTIDISGLSFTDLYYRYLTESIKPEFITALTEISADYLTEQNIIIKDSGDSTIADGETTPQSFGSVNQLASSPTLTFTIENTGETTLTISSINLPTGYSISGATPSSVAGLSSETFTVSLSTATAGTFAGDVEVNSDDPDIAVYNFAITGTVIPSNVEPIEAELVTYLVAEISDVSSRIHPGWIPRGETRPTIAVHRRSGGYAHELTGSAGFASPEFQVSVFSDDYSEARDLTEQVRVALQGYTGLMGTQTIYSITKTNEFELYEPPKDGSHNGIYHVASFFNVLHKITALTLDAPSGVVSNTDVIAALITYLLDESSLTDLISTALHPLNVPRGTALPYVTVQKKSSEDAHDLEGSAGFASARVEFICYADNYPDAVEIRDEIRLLLDGLSGVHSGCEIHAVTAQQSSDAPKLPNDGSKKWDAEISLSFDVLYRQFIPTF